MPALLKRLGVLLAFLHSVAALSVHAQHNDVYVVGTVNGLDLKPVKSATTVVARDTNDVSTEIMATVKKKAGYDLLLPLGKVYRLDFDAVGYVQKHVIIDLASPVVPPRHDGFGMKIEVALIPKVDDVDYSACLKPIGLARYFPVHDEIFWDVPYTESIKPAMKQLIDAYEAAVRSQKSK